MTIDELIRELKRARDETVGQGLHHSVAGELSPGGRRRVRVVCADRADFVWVDAELGSVEAFEGAPDLILKVRITPEQEDQIFTRLGPAEDPPG